MRSLRGFVMVAAAALVVGAVATSASQAQVRVLPNSQSLVNPYWRVAPGLPLNQAAYNIRVLGNAYSQVPPWMYGYNPYPSPIIVTPAYPVYPTYYGGNPYGYYGYPNYGVPLYGSYYP